MIALRNTNCCHHLCFVCGQSFSLCIVAYIMVGSHFPEWWTLSLRTLKFCWLLQLSITRWSTRPHPQQTVFACTCSHALVGRDLEAVSHSCCIQFAHFTRMKCLSSVIYVIHTCVLRSMWTEVVEDFSRRVLRWIRFRAVQSIWWVGQAG